MRPRLSPPRWNVPGPRSIVCPSAEGLSRSAREGLHTRDAAVGTGRRRRPSGAPARVRSAMSPSRHRGHPTTRPRPATPMKQGVGYGCCGRGALPWRASVAALDSLHYTTLISPGEKIPETLQAERDRSRNSRQYTRLRRCEFSLLGVRLCLLARALRGLAYAS